MGKVSILCVLEGAGSVECCWSHVSYAAGWLSVKQIVSLCVNLIQLLVLEAQCNTWACGS